MPYSITLELLINRMLYFQKLKLLINDITSIPSAVGFDKGFLKNLNRQMNIYVREDMYTGKHFTGIKKLDNEQLTISNNLKG